MIDGYENLTLDFSVPQAPEITSKYIGLLSKGLMFDKSAGEKEPSVTAPVMPIHND